MTYTALFSTIIFQLLLAGVGLAAPVSDVSAEGMSNSWQYGTGGGLLGLVVLVLDVIVFIEVLKSSRSPAQKVIWCLVVFLFPVIGMIIYYLFSNRTNYQRGAGYEPLS